MAASDPDDKPAAAASAVTHEAFVAALAADASRVFALLPADIAAELSRLTEDALTLDPHIAEVVSRARPRANRAESGEETAGSAENQELADDRPVDTGSRHG